MIVTKTPFRISFMGGGSDLASFYRREPGKVISTSIDKYMYISLHPYFYKNKTLLKYSQTEIVEKLSDIKHPIFREVLTYYGVNGVDISSTADIPAGTGLGSSSSFTVGLLNTIARYCGKSVNKEFLANGACDIEINRLLEPIGKQDQYAAAYGGLNQITFNPDETVDIEIINLSPDIREELQGNLLLFFTGMTRSAKNILKDQKANVDNDKQKFETQKKMIKLADQLYNDLKRNHIDSLGPLLHESWMYKKELAKGISCPEIDEFYDIAIANGASGGKVLGAGGGGFLMVYVEKENQEKVRQALKHLNTMDFNFDNDGSCVIYNA